MAEKKKKNVFHAPSLVGKLDRRQKSMDKQIEGLFGEEDKSEGRVKKQKRLKDQFKRWMGK